LDAVNSGAARPATGPMQNFIQINNIKVEIDKLSQESSHKYRRGIKRSDYFTLLYIMYQTSPQTGSPALALRWG
jgi:hypothetical protein